jgi:hypothetical protein
MAPTRFDPPGFLEDFTEAQEIAWSNWVSKRLDASKDGSPPRRQFFNPLKSAPGADAIEKDISWSAFPRTIQIQYAGDLARWKAADASRHVQDEYCEWSVERDESAKITRVTFTSEAPEYWIFLASVNRSKLVDLYRQYVSPEVVEAHLFTANGQYRNRNRWNDSTSSGAMHLIQDANTLGAEIELAAAATVLRSRNGQPLTGERELIECAHYGEPERFSDPHIGAEVNALARQKADLTLANPVGLCIDRLSTQGWKTPDASDPQEYWRIVRGSREKAVRAEYRVPKEKGFTVGDITINGRNIVFGAQIADFITIKLTGLATRIGTIDSESVSCDAEITTDFESLTTVSSVSDVESVLESYHLPRYRG